MTGSMIFVRGLFDPITDAVSRSLVELMSALADRGYDVTLLCWAGAREHEGSTFHIESMNHDPAPYGSGQRLTFLLKAARYLASSARPVETIVLLEEPTGLGLTTLYMRARGRNCSARIVFYLMDLYALQHTRNARLSARAKIAQYLRLRLDLLLLRQAKAVVVLGSCMQAMLHSLGAESAVWAPIWQDSERIHQVPADSWRAALGLSDRTVVMYHGHAGARHSLVEFHEAACRLRHRQDIQFLVFAEGSEVESLVEVQARDPLPNLSINPQTERMGLLERLSLADIHVVSLRKHATGTCVPSKTYTAMALGKPCIYVGDRRGQAAIDLAECGGGVVVDPDDSSAFAEAVQYLVDNSDVARNMGHQASLFFRLSRDRNACVDSWLVSIEDPNSPANGMVTG